MNSLDERFSLGPELVQPFEYIIAYSSTKYEASHSSNHGAVENVRCEQATFDAIKWMREGGAEPQRSINLGGMNWSTEGY